jgi:hypothetical protein
MNIISSIDLATVIGAGVSTAQAQIGVQVPKGKGQIHIGGSASSTQTDYAACLQAVGALPDLTAHAIRDTCGLPPSGSS